MIRTEKEIREEIRKTILDYHHVLYSGSRATIDINAPRALLQLTGLTKLSTLHWVIGEEFKHKFPKKGMNT